MLTKGNEEVLKKNEFLLYENKALIEMKDALEKDLIDYNILRDENKCLKREVKRLKPLVDKLTLSSNKLELILKNQREISSKAGIGYNSVVIKKISAPMTAKSKPLKNPKIICFCCKGVGHKANNYCSKRKIIKKKI